MSYVNGALLINNDDYLTTCQVAHDGTESLESKSEESRTANSRLDCTHSRSVDRELSHSQLMSDTQSTTAPRYFTHFAIS